MESRLLALSASFVVVLLLVNPTPAHADITASVTGTMLTVTADGSDTITITCVADGVKVSGMDPTGEPDDCNIITNIEITAVGTFDNAIDATAVSGSTFPALLTLVVDAGAGDDTIIRGGRKATATSTAREARTR